MKAIRFLAAMAIGSGLFVSHSAFAADPKTPKTTEAKPAEVKPAEAKPGETKPEGAPASAVKLTKPWSEIASLSEEQRVKIKAIHEKALAETNVIEKKEKEDILALLSDAQKAELKEATSKKKKDVASAKVAEKKADPK